MRVERAPRTRRAARRGARSGTSSIGSPSAVAIEPLAVDAHRGRDDEPLHRAARSSCLEQHRGAEIVDATRSRSTSYMLWPTPTSAARWTTASTPLSAPARASGRARRRRRIRLRGQGLRPCAVAVHLLNEAVEDTNTMAALQERARDVTPDKASSAGDQNSVCHGLNLSALCVAACGGMERIAH